jgi:hypothetical protein
MRLIRFGLAILAAALLAACLPVSSKVPVGSKAGFTVDRSLAGVWRARPSGEDKPGTLIFRPNTGATMMAVLVDHDGSRDEWKIQTARLGGNRFMSAREVAEKGKPATGPLAERYTLLLYRMTRARELTLYTMDDEATRAVIRAGEIAGEIEPGQDGDVRITASGPALDRFMGTQRAANLFTKRLVTLKRERSGR